MPVVPLPAKSPNSVFSNVTNVPPTPQAPPSDDNVVRAYQYAESATIAKRRNLIDDPSFVEALRHQNDLLLAKSAHPIPPWFTQAMKASLDDIKQHVSVTLSKAVDEIKKAGSVTIQDAVDELKKAGDVTMQQAVDKMTKAVDDIARLTVEEIKNTADGTTQHTVDKLKKAVKEMNYALDAKVNQLARVTAQNFNADRADGSLVPFAVVAFPDGTIPSANPDTPTVLTSVGVIKSLSAVELGHYCDRYDVGEGGSTPDDLAERQDAVRVAIGCTRKIS